MPKDYTDQVFGRLTAIEPTEGRDRDCRAILWRFRCECGAVVLTTVSRARKHPPKHRCPFKTTRTAIRPEVRYGSLVAIRDTGKRAKDGHAIWLFRCDCGQECRKMANQVAGRSVQSCGHRCPFKGGKRKI